MKSSVSLQKKITLYVGLILLISNMLLVALLLYNFYMTLPIVIPFEGQTIEIQYGDGMEQKLLILGIGIAVLATLIGTFLTSMILKKVLRPLKQLSVHMQNTSQKNLVQKADITSNVTEISSLVSSFNSMCEKQEKLFQTQKNFSSYSAHELRTPLAVIQAEIDVSQKDPAQNPKETISRIGGQISKMNLLVTQLLNLAGIQRVELKDQIPVSLLLDEVIQDLEDFADDSQIQLLYPDCGQAEECDRQVTGDHNLLYQAFYNLVQNGIKYNHPGGQVSLSSQIRNGRIYIRIANTGLSIPEAEREKIFAPFYRCRQEKDVGGNGIGLALARQIVEHHRGTLSLADSTDGCCFEVMLPLTAGGKEPV